MGNKMREIKETSETGNVSGCLFFVSFSATGNSIHRGIALLENGFSIFQGDG